MSRNIPDNINKSHVLAAAEAFDKGVDHQFSDSTHYNVVINEMLYPPKAIIGLAAKAATGVDLSPDDFSGGIGSKCFRVLESNGFEIERKLTEDDFSDALTGLMDQFETIDKQILLAQFSSKEATTSPEAIAESCDLSNSNEANLKYGKLGKLFAKYLDFSPQRSDEERPHWWRTISIPNRDTGAFRWRMKKELLSAMKNTDLTQNTPQFW